MEQQDGSWHSHGFQDPLLTAAREIGGQPLPPQTHCPTPPAPPFLNQHKFLHPFTPPLRSGLPEAVCRDVWRCGRHCFGSDAAGEQTLGCPMEADGLPSSGTCPSSGAGLSVLGNYLSFSTAFVHRSVSSHHPPRFCHPLIREHGATASSLQAQLLPACVLEVGVIHAHPGARSSSH